jgi:hypothetical protein
LLNCPGSWQAIRALPPAADVPSEYAEEGTFAHEVMGWILSARRSEPDLDTDLFAQSLRDHDFYDRTCTQAHIDTLIFPALDQLDVLEQAFGNNFTVAGVETRVKFPNVPGGFGTCDLILYNKSHILVIDWKFGAGVPVPAVYSDEHGETLNPQLAFYAAAALASQPAWFAKREIVAAIQPRCDQPLTHTVITRKELRAFVEDIELAVTQALGVDPPIRKGDWCRFAPCKTTCPLWTGPLLDLSAISIAEPVKKEETIKPGQVTPYGEYLARAKVLADTAELFKKSLDEQLHSYLTVGGTVPGWRLKPKIKQRQWVDNDMVAQTLTELGLREHEIWQRKLQTFAATDAAAKRLGVKIPDNLRLAPPSSETTIAPTDDPAPVVETTTLLEQFQASLLALKQQPLWIITKPMKQEL